MENTSKKTKSMVKIAMIAAIYCVLTLVLAPIAYGAVQFRISELLTTLPAFTPLAIPGLTLGCCLANLIGALFGLNPTGYIDAIFGTLATLLAALCSYYISKKVQHKILRYLLVPFPPVIFNAVIVGLELTFLFNSSGNFGAAFLANAISVGIGELVICYVLGIPFMILMERNDFYKRIFH
jgi:uncharacterized membrane protein